MFLHTIPIRLRNHVKPGIKLLIEVWTPISLELIIYIQKFQDLTTLKNVTKVKQIVSDLDFVKYFSQLNTFSFGDAMNWAAENGHLDIVQWLHTNRNEGCTKYAMDVALSNGHLDVLQWLRHI